MTQTATCRERWDTPEVKTGAGGKSRLRKDRYSSLLMANMSARNLTTEKNISEFTATLRLGKEKPELFKL